MDATVITGNGTTVSGQSVTLTATVSITTPGSTSGGNPTGTVAFSSKGTTITGCGTETITWGATTGTATCTTSFLASGSTYAIGAVYTSGDTNFSGSTATTVSQTVNPAATTTAVVSTTGSPSAVNQAVTYTATVSVTGPGSGTPTGNIEFLDGGSAILACGSTSGNPLSGTTATCTITYTATGSHTITAKYLEDTNYSASPTSSPIPQVVNAFGPATQLVFTQQPDRAIGANSSFPIQPKVTVEDAEGNTVTTAATVPPTKASGSNGSLSGCTTGVATVNGVASFSGCQWTATGNGDSVKAASGSLSATSNLFNITGSANKLIFSTEPGGGANGAAWSTQPVVTVEDSGGNTVTASSASIALSIDTQPGSGATLSCTNSGDLTLAASYGVANFTGCQIVGQSGSYKIFAKASGLTTATSNSFTITFGAATQLIFTQSPSNSTVGTAFGTQPKVTVEDSGGNTVTNDSSTVTLSIAAGTPTSGGPGTLSGCSGSESSGVVTFSGCSINTGGVGYELEATDGSLTPGNSGSFNITGIPPTITSLNPTSTSSGTSNNSINVVRALHLTGVAQVGSPPGTV